MYSSEPSNKWPYVLSICSTDVRVRATRYRNSAGLCTPCDQAKHGIGRVLLRVGRGSRKRRIRVARVLVLSGVVGRCVLDDCTNRRLVFREDQIRQLWCRSRWLRRP